MVRIVSLALLLVSTLAVGLTRISLVASRYTNYCGNYRNTESIFELQYHNDKLPPGTLVTLIHGWGGEDQVGQASARQFEWEDRAAITATSQGDNTWVVLFSKILAERSNIRLIRSLQFLIAIRFPDGNIFYEKGSNTRFGFYEADAWAPPPTPCINSGDPAPSMKPLAFKAVPRN